MPLPISPDPDSGSKSSLPDNAVARTRPLDAAKAASDRSVAPAPPPVRRFAIDWKIAGRFMIAGAAIGFACLAYAYLTLPDVRPLRTANPATTAFIELRARD